jgi:hypothetical protein
MVPQPVTARGEYLRWDMPQQPATNTPTPAAHQQHVALVRRVLRLVAVPQPVIALAGYSRWDVVGDQ